MTYSQTVPVSCSIMRGGTSRGVFFRSESLPQDRATVERVLLDVLGSPDIRQIDGLGGGRAQASKVAIIDKGGRPDVDVEYTFAQVDLTRPIVDWGGTCGNLAAAVGAYAVDVGLVRPTTMIGPGEATARILLVNTGQVVVTRLGTINGRSGLDGDFTVPGVPGSGARIEVEFQRPGSSYGRGVLPTGSSRDTIRLADGRLIEVTFVDAAVPVVFVAADDLGLTGNLLPVDIDNDTATLAVLENIRGTAATWLGLVDTWEQARSVTPGVPKVVLVAPPRDYMTSDERHVSAEEFDLFARQISMQRAHQTYAVTGAIATAAAAAIDGTVVNSIIGPSRPAGMRIGQPYGVIVVSADIERQDLRPDALDVRSASLGRTARHIMDGTVWVRSRIFDRVPAVSGAGTDA